MNVVRRLMLSCLALLRRAASRNARIRSFSTLWLTAIGLFATTLTMPDVCDAQAQIQQYRLTASLGVLHGVHQAYNSPFFTLYPEIQVNHGLIDNLGRIVASAYLGGWIQRGIQVESRRYCPRCLGKTYFYSGIHLGGRISDHLLRGPVGLTVFAGISRQFIRNRIGKRASDLIKTVEGRTAIEAGFRVQIPVNRRLLYEVGVQKYWYASETKYSFEHPFAVMIGLSFLQR